jgi:PAS domain S-box-containing protein
MKNVRGSIVKRIYILCFVLLLSYFYITLFFVSNVTDRNVKEHLYLTVIISLCVLVFIVFNVWYNIGEQLRILSLRIKDSSDRLSDDHAEQRVVSVNEIGSLSDEVIDVLDRLHEKTTSESAKCREIEEAYKTTGQLVEFGKNITSCLTVNDIILTSFESIQALFNTSLLTVGLYNKEKGGLDMYGIRTGDDNIYYGFDDLNDKYRWGVNCYLSQKEVMASEYNTNSNRHFSNLLFKEPDKIRESFIYVPLTFKGRKVGVLSIQDFKKNVYNGYHLSIVKNLAVYISIALANADTYMEMERQKNDLEILTEALVFARDHLEEQVELRTKEVVAQNNEIEKQNTSLAEQRRAILEKSEELIRINKELEFLSLVARKTENAIMIMDSTGNVLWINDCFTRLYNYSYPEFVKVRGSNILQTSFNPDIVNALNRCIETRKAVNYDAYNIKANGEGIWTRTTLTPVLNQNSEITHLLTIDSDITLLIEANKRIEQQAIDITNSIHYAYRIQEAILPPAVELNQHFRECFIIYKPCNIVSGDFYWWRKKDNYLAIAVADCTGHGVPGAFMSLLGISFLDEILESDNTFSAASVLCRLRDKIKSSLRQTGKRDEPTDGMNIALCFINLENNMICFSGAYNSLICCNNKKISRFKGDRMPIGIYRTDTTTFSDQYINASVDDSFYFFTDGLVDQFGGDNNKRFSTRRFYNMLEMHGDKPMDQQVAIFNETFNGWMGKNNSQLDDVCIMGFRLKQV